MNIVFLQIAISNVVTILVVVVGYFLTKRKEHEADWRKMKFDLYREYINAVAGIVDGRMTPGSEIRYHDAFNPVGLVASPEVLAAVQAYQAEISLGNTGRTQVSHDRTYSAMVNALRRDLAGRSGRKRGAVDVYMISTRPWSGPAAPTTSK